MLEKIRHYILSAHPGVHDEEMLTSLELQARTTAKMNEVVELINQLEQDLDHAIEGLPDTVDNALGEMEESGELSDILNREVMDPALKNLRSQIADLRDSVNQIIREQIMDTSANMELIDARNGNGNNYDTTGDHIRAIGNGSGFVDAVRPGTVRAGRIFPGMLGGEAAELFKGESIVMAGHWNGENGYYDKDSKEFIAHTGYRQTDKFRCAYGDMFKITSFVYGGLVCPAVIFDASGNVLDVTGEPGAGNWEPNTHIISVKNGGAAYISFICGAGQVADFRASRYSIKPGVSLPNMGGLGFWRMRAKKRTDTVTDRAQIKCWFPLAKNRTGEETLRLIINTLSMQNVDNYTVRLFGAASAESYELQLPQSASSYQMSPLLDLEAQFTCPLETADGLPITHVCAFIDFVPSVGESYMDVSIYRPTLNGVVEPINPTLHGALDTDMFMDVRPGAEIYGTYRKSIIGMGDSLMSGNTLSKDKTWFNLGAGHLNMLYYNAAVNGSPIARATGSTTAMADRIDAALAGRSPDYFVLQGGANDKRLNVPLDRFKDAIREIVGKVRMASPRCKILLMTNWRRTDSPNTLGLYDSNYVTAMLEVGEELALRVTNNYAYGINLMDPAQAAWADEGIVSGGSANIHFSVGANKYLAERFISEVTRL